MKDQAAAVAESVERPWPAPDFLNAAQRLRHEFEAAVRLEQSLTQRLTDIQSTAFVRGLPTALIAGGEDVLRKIAAEQDAAQTAVNDKRTALREFLASERQRFFALREEAHTRLRQNISEQFSSAQRAAKELRTALDGVLGAKDEAEVEERMIREWNRIVKKFNSSIPSLNVSAIPSAGGIGTGESLRGSIAEMILQDPSLRELCRGIVAAEAERRERAWAAEEARLAANEMKL